MPVSPRTIITSTTGAYSPRSLMQLLYMSGLSYRKESAISVQWLDVTCRMATFFRHSAVSKKRLKSLLGHLIPNNAKRLTFAGVTQLRNSKMLKIPMRT